MIYPFVSHTVSLACNIPINQLLTCLQGFHENILELDIPRHPYKTYENWFERGLSQLKKRIDDHQFLYLFENFIVHRFVMLDFKMGNIHFDLNPYNVWLSNNNELYFSDFDTLQKGAYAKDLFDCVRIFCIGS